MPSNTVTEMRGLIRYEPSLDDELFAFQRAAYPERRDDWVEPRWRWMFLESAKRLGVEPMVWLYRAKSGIVGHQGAIPVQLKVGSEELTTGWFVETMVLESHRGKAVGPMLVKKALEDLPLNLSLGQTEQMRELQFALGWKQVAPLDIWMYVLNAQRVLHGKKNALVRPLAAAMLKTHQFFRGLVSGGRREFNVAQIERFERQHDELWRQASRDIPCAVVRDASYLNWKYVDQPGQNFVRLEVRRDGEAAAVVVLQIREPDEDYLYRRGFLADLVVSPFDAAAVDAALRAARDEARARQADALIFPCIDSQLNRKLKRHGFLNRQPTRYFLIAATDAEKGVARQMQLAENWRITMGDSDIDRPW